jgi:hypothetical protein
MKPNLSASALAPSTLPDIIPVFPLTGVVLLPRSRLPLNIFEPRYLSMMDDALAIPGRMIGIIQPQIADTGDDAKPPLYKIGCAGRIVSFSETDDGRFLVSLIGVSRFDVVEELSQDHAYRRVRADWSRFQDDLIAPAPTQIPRGPLTRILHDYFKQQNIDADWDVVEKTPDELLVSSLVMICPFAPNERQALLEAPDLSSRADMLTTLLEMAAVPQGNDGDGGVRH